MNARRRKGTYRKINIFTYLNTIPHIEGEKSIKIQNLRGLDEKSTREIRGKECKGEEMNFNRSKFAHSEKKNSNIYLD